MRTLTLLSILAVAACGEKTPTDTGDTAKNNTTTPTAATETTTTGQTTTTGTQTTGTTGTTTTTGTTSTTGTTGTTTADSLCRSLDFDGADDEVVIRSSESLEFSAPFTISAWLRIDEHDGFSRIFDKAEADDDGWCLEINEDGHLSFGGSHSDTDARWGIAADSGYTASVWEHYAVVFTADEARMYRNATLVSTEAIRRDVEVNPVELRFGGGLAGDHFDGAIADMRIWIKELSREDIQYCMHNVPDEEDLKDMGGYWTFNEGSGEVLNDHSGNGNTGEIDGASWTKDCPTHKPEDAS
jgi:hypothetical protein